MKIVVYKNCSAQMIADDRRALFALDAGERLVE